MYKFIFYNLFSLNFDEFSIICFHLIYPFASVKNDVLHQSSDSDIEFTVMTSYPLNAITKGSTFGQNWKMMVC